MIHFTDAAKGEDAEASNEESLILWGSSIDAKGLFRPGSDFASFDNNWLRSDSDKFLGALLFWHPLLSLTKENPKRHHYHRRRRLK
jgi:hypothetical protein